MNSLSILIPAYNERENIEEAVSRCLSVLPSVTSDFEILIIDDGSTDGTGEIAERIAAEGSRVRLFRHPVNRGWGSAIKTGLANASKEWVIYVPSDNQFDPSDIAILAAYTERADVVVAARTGRCGYSFLRSVGSAVFVTLVRWMFGLRLSDFNFIHLYRRTIFEKIEIQSSGEFMCAEVLVRAHHAGFRIVEVPGIRCLPRLKGESIKVGPGIVLETLIEMYRVKRSLGRP